MFKELDRAVYELTLESSTEAEIETEVESCDTYVKRFTMLRMKYEKLTEDCNMVGVAYTQEHIQL